MEVILKGKLHNTFKKNDYTDKTTGEFKKGKYTVQLFTSQSLKSGGYKSVLTDVTVPDVVFSNYKGKEGKDVEVKCGFMSEKPVIFFGIE